MKYFIILLGQFEISDGAITHLPAKNGRLAPTLPLQEASKGIKDEETAQFYYEFLKNVGWTFGQN